MSSSPVPPRREWPRHLFLRGDKFYARVRVPPSLGHSSTHLQRSLKTDSYPTALRRLSVVAGELTVEIRAMELAKTEVPPASKRTVDEEAEWFRAEARRRGLRLGESLPDDLDMTLEQALEERLGRVVGDRLGPNGQLEAIHEGDAEARRLADLVYGRILPVGDELERFITEQDLKVRYAGRHRRAVARLKAWMMVNHGTDDVRRVSRREAAKFVDDLIAGGLSTKTANSLTSSLSVYWRWLHDRVGIEGNPWANQNRKQRAAEPLADKRSFTDAEVAKLLSGETSRTLHDLMRVAALSGMRIEEIARLTVGDTQDQAFNIRVGKTANSVRVVPIHDDLKPLVSRRVANKKADERLFDELRGSEKRELSAKASERFTAYRREQGVDERADGQRQSNIDFHSFRRWFVTKAEQARQPMHVVSAVVGHAEGRGGMTMSVYSAGPSLDQKRDVIASVRLPEGAPIGSPEGPILGDGNKSARTRAAGAKV